MRLKRLYERHDLDNSDPTDDMDRKIQRVAEADRRGRGMFRRFRRKAEQAARKLLGRDKSD